MRVKLLAAVGCVLACCTLARADEPQPPKPGPEMEKLKAMEGQWDWVAKIGPMEMKGVSTYKVGFGGFWLTEDFKGEGPGDFEGRGTTGYDPIKKKYVTTMIDSVESTMVVTEGEFDKDGKTLTQTGEGAGDDGKPQKLKTVTQFKDKDNFVMTMYAVKDGKEQVMVTVTYKRKK